jgi:hypothetical protein
VLNGTVYLSTILDLTKLISGIWLCTGFTLGQNPTGRTLADDVISNSEDRTGEDSKIDENLEIC